MSDLHLIQFETTTACNATCTMCPLPTMTRTRGRMSEALFHKIIADGMEMGVRHFIPFLNGEPFADKRIFDWLDYMAARDLTVTLFTNGSLLDAAKAERLAQYTNIESVTLSFHGGTPEAFERVMGLDYATCKANADYFLSVAPYRVQVYMTEFEDNAGTVPQFLQTWQTVPTLVGAYWNWAGDRPSAMADRRQWRQKPCERVLHQMTIMWDGRVNLCCMDIEGRVVLGDANTMPLRDIWDSNQWMRDKHLAHEFSELTLCNVCNMNKV